MILRPYQEAALADIARGWAEFRRQLLVAPTGSGKTVIFANAAKAHLPGRTLILAHREELIDQAIAKLADAAGIEAEKEKAEHHASLSAECVVASVQTMIRRLDKWPAGHFALVVADEAHHAISDSWQRVLNHFNARVLGVTATPDRGDTRNLGSYFEAIAHEIKLLDLIQAGYLSRITVRAVPLEIDLSRVRTVAGDFQADELGDALEPYLERIADAVIEHAAFRRTLAFLPLRKTSRMFADICRGKGLAVEHVDGDMPSDARRTALRAFADWDRDMLCNAMLLTEGYDDPGIDCVVVLRPTQSRALFAQMVGRGTRVAPCKENLLLLDFLWLHEKHALARPAHLIAHDDVEAETITRIAAERSVAGGGDEQLELDALADAALHEREITLRKRLAEQAGKRVATMDAVEWAIAHGSVDAATYEPTFAWEEKPITEKQAKYLRRAKIDLATVRGRGHASKILDIYFAGQKLALASPAQLATMRRMGHPAPPDTTAAEARQFFAGKR